LQRNPPGIRQHGFWGHLLDGIVEAREEVLYAAVDAAVPKVDETASVEQDRLWQPRDPCLVGAVVRTQAYDDLPGGRDARALV
jgi:hypothetical protein